MGQKLTVTAQQVKHFDTKAESSRHWDEERRGLPVDAVVPEDGSQSCHSAGPGSASLMRTGTYREALSWMESEGRGPRRKDGL